MDRENKYEECLKNLRKMKISERKKESELEIMMKRCGYVIKYGSRIGQYCNKKSDGEIYESVKGPRRFCERCIKGRYTVRDIVGKSKEMMFKPAKK
jgi:hypothetical protein